MRIFVAHSSNYDFVNELYLPLRKSELNKKHDIFLPQEKGREVITVDIIRNSDVVIAEVSYPSTGQGIELGWSNIFKIPIICFFQEGRKYSTAINKLTKKIIQYKNSKDLIDKIGLELNSI